MYRTTSCGVYHTPSSFLNSGIERLQEGLIKVLHGSALVKSGKERRSVNAVEHGAGPIQHLRQIERFELARIGHFPEQLANNRDP